MGSSSRVTKKRKGDVEDDGTDEGRRTRERRYSSSRSRSTSPKGKRYIIKMCYLFYNLIYVYECSECITSFLYCLTLCSNIEKIFFLMKLIPPIIVFSHAKVVVEDGFEFRHKKAENWGDKKKEQEMKEKLEAAKMKRQVYEKVLKTKGLADTELDGDALSWVNKMRKQEEEKRRAEERVNDLIPDERTEMDIGSRNRNRRHHDGFEGETLGTDGVKQYVKFTSLYPIVNFIDKLNISNYNFSYWFDYRRWKQSQIDRELHRREKTKKKESKGGWLEQGSSGQLDSDDEREIEEYRVKNNSLPIKIIYTNFLLRCLKIMYFLFSFRFHGRNPGKKQTEKRMMRRDKKEMLKQSHNLTMTTVQNIVFMSLSVYGMLVDLWKKCIIIIIRFENSSSTRRLMNSSDTPLGTLTKQLKKQEQLQTPYLVLSGSGRSDQCV
uniref:Protein TIC 214 n=1 Tax=Heterorhabditis bacteriophora TaxID=37862 RepID=A0A1I7W9S0_HETBA